MNRTSKSLILILVVFLVSCGGSSGQSNSDQTADNKEESSAEESSTDNSTKLQQYVVQGKKLYQAYCMNCHQANGEGLAQLYPPLAGADYLLKDLPRAACIILNGKTEEITVNGKTYNQMMPGYPTMTPLEVAEILTYITNSWGNEEGISNVKDVEKWLQECEK